MAATYRLAEEPAGFAVFGGLPDADAVVVDACEGLGRSARLLEALGSGAFFFRSALFAEAVVAGLNEDDACAGVPA